METKDLTPEYVLQPHAISRASYRLSAIARKIIVMAMSLIPFDLSSRKAQFNFNEFCTALGMEKGGDTYKRIKESIKECMISVIEIETEEKWKSFTWISYADYDKRDNIITIIFSDGLLDYLIELKKMYARIELNDFGKLQSLYAIRLFEMAKSYESLAGKNGNKKNEWFFERTIEELRKIFGIEKREYILTNNFRLFVIEKPIQEINKSNLGLEITPEYIRKGKFLIAIKFLCKINDKTVKSRKKKNILALPAPTESPIKDYSLKEKELKHIKKLYHEEYVELYTALLKSPPNNFFKDHPHIWSRQADSLACQELIDKHSIRK